MICKPPAGIAASDFARYLLVRVKEVWPLAYGEDLESEAACPFSCRIKPDLRIYPSFSVKQAVSVFRMEPSEIITLSQQETAIRIDYRGQQAKTVYDFIQQIPALEPLVLKEMACASTP